MAKNHTNKIEQARIWTTSDTKWLDTSHLWKHSFFSFGLKMIRYSLTIVNWCLGLIWSCSGQLISGNSTRDFRVKFNWFGFNVSTCAMSKCGAVFFFEEVHYFWPQSWSVEFNLKRWNAWRNKWNVSWTFVRGWSRLWLAGVCPACSGVRRIQPKPPSNGNTNQILHVIRIFKI